MDYFDEIISRNVDSIYPNKQSFLKKLNSNTKLRIYFGIDPSSPKIHLGNAIALHKLAQLQNLGHKIILLIGDFTGMIGDPTDKESTRQPLTEEQVAENAKTYKKQAEKILNFSGKNPVEIAYNSHWLGKLSFSDVVKLSANFTVQQLLERDMFQERLRNNKPISVHEFLYPIMQGYDSVAMDVDVEVGGTDQTFNMMIGRQLQLKLNKKEKFVLTIPLLEGTDGRKMSKSFGNSVDVDDTAEDMFGKVMSLKDELIWKYFEMCTDIDLKQLQALRKESVKLKPVVLKKRLAFEITKLYHGEAAANKAQSIFEAIVQRKETPDELDEIKFSKSILPKPYLYFLIEANLVSSNSEAVRLAKQGGVEFAGQKIFDIRQDLYPTTDNLVVRAGKRNFVRLKFV